MKICYNFLSLFEQSSTEFLFLLSVESDISFDGLLLPKILYRRQQSIWYNKVFAREGDTTKLENFWCFRQQCTCIWILAVIDNNVPGIWILQGI